MDRPSPCCACGATALAAHLTVAAPLGEQGLIPTTDRYGEALADIVRCGRCGHMQLDPMPAGEALAGAYEAAASEDYVGEATGQRATARAALEWIEQQAPRRGSLLDLGCWVGFLLAEARARGWAETVGVEPSAFASRYARETLGLDVRTDGVLTAELAPGHFDAVVLGDVIEHLPGPGEALDRIATVLRPGGVLWLALPDAGSRLARFMGPRWWSVLPTHVQYFTRGSLTRLLEGHGYEVLGVRTAPKAFTVGYYLSRTGGYSAPVGRALVSLATALRVDQRLWAPDFGDRMAVLARRRDAE